MKNKLKSTKSTGLIKIISRSLFIVIVLCSMSFISVCIVEDDLSGRGGSCDSSSDCEGSLHCLGGVCRTGGECYRDQGCLTGIYSCQNEGFECWNTEQECSADISCD